MKQFGCPVRFDLPDMSQPSLLLPIVNLMALSLWALVVQPLLQQMHLVPIIPKQILSSAPTYIKCAGCNLPLENRSAWMSAEGNHPTPPPPQITPHPAGGEASPKSWWFHHWRRNQESTGTGTGSGSPDLHRSGLGLGKTSGNTAYPKSALIAKATRELIRDTSKDLGCTIISPGASSTNRSWQKRPPNIPRRERATTSKEE